MMDSVLWEVLFMELQKEEPMKVLFFIMHYYYGRSMKDLANLFDLRPEHVSLMISEVQQRIINAYRQEEKVMNLIESSQLDYQSDPLNQEYGYA